MILLEANQSLLFGGIPLTDWLQAIGAIVAIVGVIVGFYQLFKDSKEKQSQIDTLTALAKESKEQTIHLASQVDQMIEGNNLQSRYISLYKITVSTNEELLKIQQEKNNLDKQLRKHEIRPNFHIAILSNFYVYNLGESRPEIDNIKLGFQNIGENCTLLEYVELERNSQKIDLLNFLNKEYPKNKGFIIEFKWFHLNNNKSDLFIHFKLIYEDIDRNKYFQIYEGSYNGDFKISKPIEII